MHNVVIVSRLPPTDPIIIRRAGGGLMSEHLAD